MKFPQKRNDAFRVVLALWIALTLSAQISSSKACYLSTPSGYQRMGGADSLGPYATRSQCESVNSQYFRGAGTCSSSCVDSDAAPAYRSPSADRDAALRQQNSVRLRQEREKQRKQAEQESIRREQAAKAQFEKSRQQALELMKGNGNDALTIKSGSAFFGLKGSPGTPEGIKIRTDMPKDAAKNAAMTWACAIWIADFVFPAAMKGDSGEVHFLGEQVGRVLSGEATGVECPETLPIPTVKGIVLGVNSPTYRFYDALFGAVSIQSDQLATARRHIAELIDRKQLNEADVQGLERKLKAQTDVASKDRIEKPEKPVQPEVVKDHATEAALAALKMAQEALAKIKQYEAMHKKVQLNPASAGKLMGKIEQ